MSKRTKKIKELVPVETGTFESYDGTPIYYESRGRGEPIVLVYGIACLLNHFHYQVDYFAHTHQVISFDLRGHHLSGRPANNSELTLRAIGKDLGYLLRTLGLKQAHFVGHSFGAPALLAAFDETPGIFKTMTFINGFAKNPIKGMFGLDVVEPLFHFVKKQFEENPVLWNSLWRAAVDNSVASVIASLAGGFNMKLTDFKDIEIYTRGVSQVPLDVFLPLFEDMMHFDGNPIAAKVDKPVLIMSGDRDFVTPQKFQHELHHTIPGSELVSIAYGSHCCQLDFPDYVNLKIEKFIEAHK